MSFKRPGRGILFVLATANVIGGGILQASAQEGPTEVLVAYYSYTGNTEELAGAVAEGVRRAPRSAVKVRRIDEVVRRDLEEADAIVLGSPTYYGNLAGPMKSFIDDWAFEHGVVLADKIGGAFATGDGTTGGKEHVVISLLLAMMNAGMIVAGPIHEVEGVVYGYFGASAVTGPSDPGISEEEREEAMALGERIARAARRWDAGEGG